MSISGDDHHSISTFREEQKNHRDVIVMDEPGQPHFVPSQVVNSKNSSQIVTPSHNDNTKIQNKMSKFITKFSNKYKTILSRRARQAVALGFILLFLASFLPAFFTHWKDETRFVSYLYPLKYWPSSSTDTASDSSSNSNAIPSRLRALFDWSSSKARRAVRVILKKESGSNGNL